MWNYINKLMNRRLQVDELSLSGRPMDVNETAYHISGIAMDNIKIGDLVKINVSNGSVILSRSNK